MQERDNILRILKETSVAFKAQDAFRVKQLSNQTINTASRTQDADNISVAVIVYGLGKVLEREDQLKTPECKGFCKIVVVALNHAIKDIEKDNMEDFRKDMELIRKQIGKLSGNFKKYVQHVFRRAQVNKASRIYEHGISMERTAKLLGVTMWELANYAGPSGIPNVKESRTLSAKERIKLVEGIFR